jgi:L,D-peptidoglycan transpeptidase YkuD (ErfK/YbiS/YcfS/YnhG family)
MLTTGKRPRRAAARSRRPLLLLGVLVAVLWVARQEVPSPYPFDSGAARAVAQRSLWALEPRGVAAELSVRLEQAEATTRRELARPRLERDEEALESAWAAALGAASRAHLAARQARAHAESRWRTLEPEAVGAVAVARERAPVRGMGRSAGFAVQRAAVALGEAQGLARAGRFAEASRAAETAIEQANAVTATYDALLRPFRDPAQLALWRRMVREAIAESANGQTTALVVDKLNRRLLVYRRGKRVASFDVELGTGGLRRKLHDGDQATPEGHYRVVDIKTGARTKYYKALLLDYPNEEDRARYARERAQGRVPRGRGIGGLIEIHGDGGRGDDWTNGCVALPNRDMDRLLQYVGLRTPVTIVGTAS